VDEEALAGLFVHPRVIRRGRYEDRVAVAGSPPGRRAPRRREIGVSISIRTILLVAAAVAIGSALASIRSILLVIFVSVFSVAVLSPVATAMERRFGWRRAVCASVLVLGIVLVLGAMLLVLVQAAGEALRGLSHDLPQIVDKVRHSGLGDFVNRGSNSLGTLKSRERHHGRGRQGLRRRRARRRIGLRGRHARLLGRLPDALRPRRRAAPA